MKISETEKNYRLLHYSLFAAAILIHIFMFNNYLSDDIDDAWSHSFIYSYTEKGYEYDSVFRTGEVGGVAFFGKTYARVYSAVFNIFGWTKITAHGISSFFVYASIVLWYFIFRKIGLDKKQLAFLVLLFLIAEPFLSMANKTRSDAFAFFFASLSLYLFMDKRFFFSALTGMIAFETHPMGLSAFIYSFAYFLSTLAYYKDDKKRLIRDLFIFISGIALGALYYIFLHYGAFSSLGSELSDSITDAVKNYLLYYFLYSTGHRHLVDLIVFLSMFVIFVALKMYKTEKLLIFLLAGAILQSIILPRANHNYAVFAYPVFLYMAVLVATRLNKAMVILFLFFLLYTPQHIIRIEHNRQPEPLSSYSAKLQNLITDENLPVFGGGNEWYAFMERDYFHFMSLNDHPEIETCYLIIDDNFREKDIPVPDRFTKRIKVGEIEFNGEKSEILLLTIP
ncbi:MAG: hypothetical protein JXR86_03575 [Spirochaetales bacterium]|nr:hypothetical protein [Spirochaetales bacterium]